MPRQSPTESAGAFFASGATRVQRAARRAPRAPTRLHVMPCSALRVASPPVRFPGGERPGRVKEIAPAARLHATMAKRNKCLA
jgi:hypothetical protein